MEVDKQITSPVNAGYNYSRHEINCGLDKPRIS